MATIFAPKHQTRSSHYTPTQNFLPRYPTSKSQSISKNASLHNNPHNSPLQHKKRQARRRSHHITCHQIHHAQDVCKRQIRERRAFPHRNLRRRKNNARKRKQLPRSPRPSRRRKTKRVIRRVGRGNGEDLGGCGEFLFPKLAMYILCHVCQYQYTTARLFNSVAFK